MKRKIWYECDPARNVACRKRSCFRNGGSCELTSRKEAAALGPDGKPVRVNLRERLVRKAEEPADLKELDRIIHELDRIWEVGIVNAYEDRQAIHEAIGWLELMKHLADDRRRTGKWTGAM